MVLSWLLNDFWVFHSSSRIENNYTLFWLDITIGEQLFEHAHADGGFGVDSQALELGQAQARRQIISRANGRSVGDTSGQAARCVPFDLLRG